MATHTLSAEPRKIFGRKVRSLRRTGIIPGNVFGPKTKSVAIQVGIKELVAIIKKAGETSLIELKISGETKSRPVLVAGYHVDPVTGILQHVDLHEVDLTQKTKAAVPVHTVGVSSAVASGKILVVLHNELEVEALPTDLPDVIEIDIAGLTEVGATIHGKDLKVDRSKVTLSIADDEPVVTVQEPAKEEVVAPPAPAEGEAAPAAEGEKPKEGEASKAEAKPGDAKKPEAGKSEAKKE